PLEFRILHLLLMNQGRVIPYSRLIEYGWGYYDENNSNLLKTHVSHLRRKLRLAAEGPGSIRSILGVGYSLAREN
ncbi:MAG TPA: helix-turn-helix domain-containing protein, partial [Chloroflexota bacterium]|nr:helix-turn-helix domain-containing protein [Chloroflexota bacterium]